MKAFYSAGEVEETGLTLGTLTQGVRSKINLVPLIVEPENLVTVLLELKLVEAAGMGTKKLEHLALCQQRPQIHNAGKTVVPDDLDDPENDRLRTMHSYYVSHLSSPVFAVP